MMIMVGVLCFVMGVSAGGFIVSVFSQENFIDELRARDDEILRLKSVLDGDMVDIKRRVWDDAKAEAWAEFEAEMKRKRAEFHLPVLEGRTWARVRMFCRRWWDMRMRGVELTYRNAAEYGIGRTVYDDFREWFVSAGYWSWEAGSTPEWTMRGNDFMGWFELRFMKSDEVIEKMTG